MKRRPTLHAVVLGVLMCCAIAAQARQVCAAGGPLVGALALADILPAELDRHLEELGVRTQECSVELIPFGGETLYAFETYARDVHIVVLANTDGVGMAVFDDPIPGAGNLFVFDISSGRVTAQALPPGCITMVAGMVTSLLSSLYTCASGNPVACVTGIIGFVATLVLIPSECNPQYTISVLALNGTVEQDPDKSTYSYREQVSLTAVPDTGYVFVAWGGDVFGSENPTTVVIDSDMNITATFTAQTYTLTTSAENGLIRTSPSSLTYTHGQQVIATADPNEGYAFSEWGGDLSGSQNPTTIIMDADKTISATFVPAPEE